MAFLQLPTFSWTLPSNVRGFFPEARKDVCMAKSVVNTEARQAATPASEVVVWDDAVPKLGLRIRQTRKTWIVQWSEAGRSRKQTLGRADEIPAQDARRLAVGLMDMNSRHTRSITRTNTLQSQEDETYQSSSNE